jgi:hypothetical protein
MLQRELTYQISFERLVGLGRSAGRKAFRTVWLLTWAWILAFLFVVLAVVVFLDVLRETVQPFGLAAGPELLLLAAALVFLGGALWIRKLRWDEVRRRARFNDTIRLTQDDGGLRFATEEVEHYLKWKGIRQMLLEPDGVAVSHGSLFFLIPDTAFADAAERRAFIRDVYARLDEDARAISVKHVGPALA